MPVVWSAGSESKRMLIVPLSASTTSVRLKLLSCIEPPAGDIRIRVLEIDRTVVWASSWRRAKVGRIALDLWYAVVEFDGLAADTTYTLVPGGRLDGGFPAQVCTLPSRLPSVDSNDRLRIVLASCFDHARGKATPLGRMLGAHGSVPHLKLLCGDQVYLDLPMIEDLPSRPEALYNRFLAKYLENWLHRHGVADDAGFGAFLQTGANVFLADDHEFWNNYPFECFYVGESKTPARRKAYAAGASALFRVFQADLGPSGPRTFQTFTIGPDLAPQLAVAVLDGRYHRTSKRTFASEDLQRTLTWIKGLTCPGVLVLSQPLFDHAPPKAARATDAYISHFVADYARLSQALTASRHDVLLLSGDNHGGRVARAQVPEGPVLWEVLASPLALVREWSIAERINLLDLKRLRGYHGDFAIDTFPALTRPGEHIRRARVETLRPVITWDHYSTIEFAVFGKRVHFETKFWPLDGAREPTQAAPFDATNHSGWEELR